MEKKNYSQLELFSQTKADYQTKKGAPNTFLSYIWNYEKVILIAIGFIIMGTISFSLGVERGRRLAILKFNSRLDMATKIQSLDSKNKYQSAVQKQDSSVDQSQPVIKPVKEYIQNYTIQVATYQTKTYAEKEVNALRKKGFSALVSSKGKYNIVYVGNFSSKETAASLLLELKKRYRDCFIKRL